MTIIILYLITGAINGLFVIITAFGFLRSPYDKLLNLQETIVIESKFNRLIHVIKKILIQIFIWISLVSVWPFTVWHSRLIKKNFSSSFKFLVYGSFIFLEHFLSIFTFTALLLIFVYVQITKDYNDYLLYFVWIFLIGTFAKHLSFILSAQDLQKRIRQSNRNPYIVFSVIMVFDLLAFTLALYFLLFWNNLQLNIFLNDYKAVMMQIITFRRISFSQTVTNFNSILIYATGFLYYGNILKNAFNFKYFKRQDEDYIALGQKCLRLGLYNKGLEYLSKIENKSSNSLEVSISLNLGLNLYENAKENAKLLCRINKNNEIFPDYKAVIAMYLVAFEYTERTIFSTIDNLVKDNISDFYMRVILNNVTIAKIIKPEGYNKYFKSEVFKNNYQVTYFCYLHGLEEYEKSLKELDKIKIESLSHSEKFIVICTKLLSEFFILINESKKNNKQKATEDDKEKMLNLVYGWHNNNKYLLNFLFSKIESDSEKLICFHVLSLTTKWISPFFYDNNEELQWLIDECEKEFTHKNAKLFVRNFEKTQSKFYNIADLLQKQMLKN